MTRKLLPILAILTASHVSGTALIDTTATDYILLKHYKLGDSAPFLKKFDEELHRRKERQLWREAEIKEMKLILYSESYPYSRRIDACSRLVMNYCSYQLDSAIHYAIVKKNMAIGMNDQRTAMEAELNFGEALANTGMNSDLEYFLDKIQVEELDEELQRYYLYLRTLLYSNLNSQTDNPELQPRHLKLLVDAYEDLIELQTPENSGFMYYLTLVRILDLAGRHAEVRQILENEVTTAGMTLVNKADYYYRLGRACERGAGTMEEAKSYLALAALADMEDADKEHYAAYRLAQIIYSEGDIKRSHRYMKVAIDDATFSNSFKRLYRITQMIPVIDNAYIGERNRQQMRLHILLGVSILLIILLAITLAYISRLYRNYRRATMRLSVMYNELTELTSDLNDANVIKETYIVRYMNLYMDSMDEMSSRLKRIGKFMNAGKDSEVRKMLDTSELEKENMEIFYQNFDATFLNLFPTFVEEYNKLLCPEFRITLKNPNRLNTELRIYALVRLGVTDSVKISEFLHYSLSTIYNNRTTARNKAAVDRNHFEKNVAQIGRSR